MKYDPYPFQKLGIVDAYSFLTSSTRSAKRCYAAPTGCGKSVVELAIQAMLEDCWIISPREEILDGMMDKLGASGDTIDHNMCTPIRMRNMLMAGTRRPKYMIYDEGHHHNAESWQQLDLLTGIAPSIAFTATPYRGSPKSTREFLEHWGDPVWLISFLEAAAEGYIKIPTFETLPLVDDDLVEVSGGDFKITSIDGVTVDRLGSMADEAKRWYTDKWDVSTVFSLPSSVTCQRLQKELGARGLPAMIVSSETPREERRLAFRATVERVVCLLNISVVSEGIDFPFRRWVDLAPTLSPVLWVQRMGRITRPGPGTPHVICTNRNLARHAYIMEGALPNDAVVENVDKFPPSERAHTRVLGLEALGRFKPTSAKLNSGLTLSIYSLSVPVGSNFKEYCCVVHPTMDPVWAEKESHIVDGKREYGAWTRCESPQDLRGFSSAAPRELSPKQKAWWDRSAPAMGIAEKDVTRKNFQILPVLCDLGLRFV